MSLKAIQTEYHGWKFRSRLEARWAVFFDVLGIEWQYETEGFRLPSGNYLPDFWLLTVSMWAEVKPKEFTPREKLLARELAKASGFPVLKLIGMPEDKPYFACMSDDGQEIDFCLTNYHDYPRSEHRFFAMPSAEEMRWLDTEIAAKKARGARFEYGEQGARLW